MILLRLNHYLEKNNILPNSQNGFRKGRSCQHCLGILVADIHKSFIEKKTLCAVLLDIKSAFDNIIPSKLQELLVEIKIPYHTRSFIDKMLTNKKLYFKIRNEVKGPFKRNFGSPQGCRLSPILYTIYTMKMQQVLDSQVNPLFFADDSIFYCSSSNIDNSLNLLESNVEKICNFLVNYGLPLSPGKKNQARRVLQNKNPKPNHLQYKQCQIFMRSA